MSASGSLPPSLSEVWSRDLAVDLEPSSDTVALIWEGSLASFEPSFFVSLAELPDLSPERPLFLEESLPFFLLLAGSRASPLVSLSREVEAPALTTAKGFESVAEGLDSGA